MLQAKLLTYNFSYAYIHLLLYASFGETVPLHAHCDCCVLMTNCGIFLLQYVCHHLKDTYDVNCGRKFVIDLDSRSVASTTLINAP